MGAWVALAGVAVTEPPAAWQPVQFAFLDGLAVAAEGPSMATRTAAVRPVASTAAFGMLIFFKLNIFTKFLRRTLQSEQVPVSFQ